VPNLAQNGQRRQVTCR